MPLTARLRDEDNERINQVLKQLMAIDYVPNLANDAINDLLESLGFSLQSLLEMPSTAIISQLEKLHFDWKNAEQFADFLALLSTQLPNDTYALKAKAVGVYDYVQSASKTFSWGISGKIATAKNQRHEL